MKDDTEANDEFHSSVETFSFILIFRGKISLKQQPEPLSREVIQLQHFMYGEVHSSYFFDNFCTFLLQKYFVVHVVE